MKRLLKVSIFSGMLTFFRMLAGFLVAKVIAVYTGPSGLALLGQVQSLVTSLNGIINSPASSGVVKYTAQNNSNGFITCSPWWKASLFWVGIITIIILPIGIIFSNNIAYWILHDDSLGWIVLTISFFLPLSAIGTLCNSVINGQQNYRRFITLGVLSTFISSSCMICLVIFTNIKGAIFAAAIQSSLIGIVLFIFNLKQPWMKIKYWFGKQDIKALKDIANYMFMSIIGAIAGPVAIIFLRNILIAEVGWIDTGYWQAVWKISEVYLGVITIALGTYYLPRLASLSSSDAIILEIKKTSKIIIPIVLMLAILVYLLRDVAIYLLFTEQFNPARDLFLVQLIGDVIKIISWLYAYPMLSQGATKWFVSSELIFSFLLVVLGYFLIPIYGVQGANIAYLMNYTLYLIFVFINIKRFSK